MRTYSVCALLLGSALHGGVNPARLAAQSGEHRDSTFIATHYVKRELRIAMRDGVRLFTALYIPTDASVTRRYPIVLQRTPFSAAPYGTSVLPTTLGPDPFMLRDQYIFVTQEVRGRYLSEGTFENVRPLLSDAMKTRDPRAVDEATDAFDTIDWLVRHVPEHDGRVGLFGVSYGGYYAAAAALSRHPAIVASSLQAPVMDFFFEDFHHNGALLEAHLGAFPVFGTARGAPTSKHWWLPDLERVADFVAGDYDSLLTLGPLRDATARLLPNDAWWRAVVAHPDYDAFWQARAMSPRLRGIAHPVLVVGGWFDAENLYGSLEAYRALRERSPAASVSLAMGPFGHRGWAARDAEQTVHTVHGDLYFGDSLATVFQRDVEAPFFRAHLKGVRGAAADASPSMLFDTGRKTWARFTRWPAPNAQRRSYFFRRDGSLAATPLPAPNAVVEYASDPLQPVPSRCAGPTVEDGALNRAMSDDQRCFTSRPDVAVFQTGTLGEDATFAGEITARLSVSTTGTDADFVVKVIDVYPPDEPNNPYRRDTVRLGGYHQLVRGEIMRGRYRRSFSAPEPFRPDEMTEVVVRLPDVFHTFRKGHRIMVQVQSSWFPMFDRNPQRYVRSIYEADARDFVRATQRISVSARAACRLDVLVLP